LLFALGVVSYIATAYFGWVASFAAWFFQNPLQQLVFTVLIMVATIIALLVSIAELAKAKRGDAKLNSEDERV
jgi:uncharacterized membrane protein